MDAGESFVGDGEAAEAMEPRERALNDPAGRPQATAVRCAARGEPRRNAAGLQRVAMRLRVVGPIPLDQCQRSRRSA